MKEHPWLFIHVRIACICTTHTLRKVRIGSTNQIVYTRSGLSLDRKLLPLSSNLSRTRLSRWAFLVHYVRAPYGNSLIKLNVIMIFAWRGVVEETVVMVRNGNHVDQPSPSSLDLFARFSPFYLSTHSPTSLYLWFEILDFSLFCCLSVSQSTAKEDGQNNKSFALGRKAYLRQCKIKIRFIYFFFFLRLVCGVGSCYSYLSNVSKIHKERVPSKLL